jgi:hypothetical protein
MSNPIKNLGDYNKIREDLQAVGGNIEVLYKNAGDTAVAKAAPKLLAKGGIVGASLILGVIGTAYGGNKLFRLLKDRKAKLENEPTLKKEFIEAVEAECLNMDNEEITDCDEINDIGVDIKAPFSSIEGDEQIIYIDEDTAENE